MPKRSDLKSILIIGAGPIIIGQACEFDYSGAQACKALREEGYKVILVNSNPATIMTDPATADVTYIEPITWQVVEKIIAKERPDAILPTMGGQTALNCALDLHKHGVLAKYGVEMIGANEHAIEKAEDRLKFKDAMTKIGLGSAKSGIAHSMEEAWGVQKAIQAEIGGSGFPMVIRPSFTLGGTGGGIAYNPEEFEEICKRGLDLSPTNELLIEESLIGWKEYEMEVVRDRADNCIIVCSIENLDPMGIHTGDSITVAPAQTLTDREYQLLRNASIAILREIGVDTGGSNVQFSINPRDGRMVVIEMNPRVSRSSALASKATGFPIAKIAAKLAVGYTLDELKNDITGGATPASFEPSIDYVVTKIPRFAFEKFPDADNLLTTQMKSVGETMAIGRTFKESFQKALRGLEVGAFGFGCDNKDLWNTDKQPSIDDIRAKLGKPNPDRVWYLRYAFKAGMSIDDIFDITYIDPWFLDNLKQIVDMEESLRKLGSISAADDFTLRRAKQFGFSDRQLAHIWQANEADIRRERKRRGITAVFKSVDTCAAEFKAYTPYFYSTYEDENEAPKKAPGTKRIMILGGGPNRIGQGIEFDYCCCHASYALRELGIESVMVNSNPETVSTDYDTSDLLFFEPLTVEDVLNICDVVEPDGVIVQFGGQTPLNLARALASNGVPIIGTSVDTIEDAEDREKFQRLLHRTGLKQPANGIARTMSEARAEVAKVGYPVLVRPSFVLGGRAMEICYDNAQLEKFAAEAFTVSQGQPVLIDRFLEDAIEVDVDCLSDGETVIVPGIMEHIEEAGVHSGDSACAIPPYSLQGPVLAEIREAARRLAVALNVRGLMNIQFAIKKEDGRQQVYVLEVNPRASRTVPFVAKATGMPVAAVAAKIMAGVSLVEQGITTDPIPSVVSVKESVFPFIKFHGVDIVLGPEMRSTGEVMGVSERFSIAFAKSQLAAGVVLPKEGTIFLSLAAPTKKHAVRIGSKLRELGYDLLATEGTARLLEESGIEVKRVKKLQEGNPNLIDYLVDGAVKLIINTPSGKGARTDEGKIRAAAVMHGAPCITTIPAVDAVLLALEALRTEEMTVQSLQDRFPQTVRTPAAAK